MGLAFRLPPVYFLGLLLVACCPGGSSSNVFSMLAKGDVALSVTLTALSSLITLFTIPLVMGFAARFVAVHAGAAIELPVGKLLVQNIVLLFLPMICGALFRHWRPRAARRVHELLGRVAFPALMLLAAVFFFWIYGKEDCLAQVNLARQKPLGGWFYPLAKYGFCGVTVFVLILGALLGGIG